MEQKKIKTFQEYLAIIDNLTEANHEILLFRGQSDNSPLLPSIARKDPKFNSIEVEKEMLKELKRRTQLTIKTTLITDWEWLVYAQHFGMKTRLLDWSSNPLTALWFACSNEYKINQNSYVYIFIADKSLLINTAEKGSPFVTTTTRILRPALNNERIIAQAGWFTSHIYAKDGKFIALENNRILTKKLIQVEIPAKIKKEVLSRLSIFGINSQSLFPDVIGICNHLNWMFVK